MKKWIKRIATGGLSLAVLAVIGGATYEVIARARAAWDFPAPGRLVDIGGRHIQIDCRGTGAPIVVFESGLDNLGSLSWAAVHDTIAQTTRACAYSRAGIMWSDAAGRPFSSANVAEDLHNALVAAGEKAPYVMVGHSIGGPYLLTFTDRYGGDVAGLVLIDASHPDQIARMRAATGKDLAPRDTPARVAGSVAWTGLVRLALPNGPPLPPNAPAMINGPSTAWFAMSLSSLAQEMGAVETTFTTAGKTRQLGARPLVVLTHSVTTPEALKQMELTAAQGDRLDTEWRTMQEDEATWSTHGRHEIVPRASHYIQFDEPQAVIAAVHDVVGQVRQTTPN